MHPNFCEPSPSQVRTSYIETSSSSVSVESSAVYSTDGQTDIFQTEKQRQKGTNGDESMPPPPEASSPFAQTSKYGEQAQENRSLPVPPAGRQHAIVYYYTNQVNPKCRRLQITHVVAQHTTMPFVLNFATFPQDIFGKGSLKQSGAVGGLVFKSSICAHTLIDIQ